MTLAEFLSFKKFDIEDDIINNPTSFTEDSLRQTITDSINLLNPIRSSGQRTAKIIKSIMEQHMKKRVVGGHYDEFNNQIPDTWINERTIESDLLNSWLYDFCEQNLSYINAYNAILPYFNNSNPFPRDLKYINDSELLDLIKKDDEEENKNNFPLEVISNESTHSNKQIIESPWSITQMSEIIDSIPYVVQSSKKYNNFNELLSDAIAHNSIEIPKNKFDKAMLLAIHDFGFAEFLRTEKGLEDEDYEKYSALLTKDNWIEYMEYLSTQGKIAEENARKENDTWKSSKNTPPDLISDEA